MNTVFTGKVKFFNDSKGFGFITENETKKEYFVHHSGCKEKITKDNLVTFQLEEGNRGPKAVAVQLTK
jgi:cold shock protein